MPALGASVFKPAPKEVRKAKEELCANLKDRMVALLHDHDGSLLERSVQVSYSVNGQQDDQEQTVAWVDGDPGLVNLMTARSVGGHVIEGSLFRHFSIDGHKELYPNWAYRDSDPSEVILMLHNGADNVAMLEAAKARS